MAGASGGGGSSLLAKVALHRVCVREILDQPSA